MADDVLLSMQKCRSASVCAPGNSSMEAMAAAAGGGPSGTPPLAPDSAGGTPGSGRRRRPAVRSQSARLSAGKSVRRRAAGGEVVGGGATPGAGGGLRSGASEPRLCDAYVTPATPEASPGLRRRGSSRRSVHHGHSSSQAAPRRNMAFLDVPDGSAARGEDEDEDSYRLRSFSLTSKGVVNRGDSFRRRRSRSNSLIPPSVAAVAAAAAAAAAAEEAQGTMDDYETTPAAPPEATSYRVAIMGAQGVGKTALISQFMTSECINAYDRQRDEPKEQTVSIMLNGEESELRFINITNTKVELDKLDPPDAFVILYSVIDKASFQRTEAELTRLQDWGMLRTRPAILVGNKVDLVRSRAISSQDGKCLACTFRAKFIEISVGISHNVDELLVGILNQIRLKQFHTVLSERDNTAHWYKSRGVVRASMKARQMFTWLFGKEDSKFKNCENLHVL